MVPQAIFDLHFRAPGSRLWGQYYAKSGDGAPLPREATFRLGCSLHVFQFILTSTLKKRNLTLEEVFGAILRDTFLLFNTQQKPLTTLVKASSIAPRSWHAGSPASRNLTPSRERCSTCMRRYRPPSFLFKRTDASSFFLFLWISGILVRTLPRSRSSGRGQVTFSGCQNKRGVKSARLLAKLLVESVQHATLGR